MDLHFINREVVRYYIANGEAWLTPVWPLGGCGPLGVSSLSPTVLPDDVVSRGGVMGREALGEGPTEIAGFRTDGSTKPSDCVVDVATSNIVCGNGSAAASAAILTALA